MEFRLKIRSKVCIIVLLFGILMQAHLSVSDAGDSQEDNLVDQSEDFVPKSLQHILNENTALLEIPLQVQKNFVYYLSGFDDENRPVWVIEAGKWDLRSMIEGGDKKFKQFDDFVQLALYRILNSTEIKLSEDEHTHQFCYLVDLENFDLKQLTSIPTIKYLLSRFKTFLPVFSKMHAAYLVNTNYVAEALIKILKPILGREFDKFEIYGNNKPKWIPQLLRNIPRDQLPEWYGGAKNFTPYQVYG